MATPKGIRQNVPRYEVWRYVNEGYRITRRTSMASADDTYVARDLTSDEMWAMLKLLEQPCVVLVETKPYDKTGVSAWEV